MPEVPRPEQLPSDAEIARAMLPHAAGAVRRYYERERPIEMRPVDSAATSARQIRDGTLQRLDPRHRAAARRPAIHQCVLAYASDMTLLDAALIPHGRTVFEKTIMAASLDHALWFHRPFRADEWLLYAQDSPTPRARAASPAA